MINEIKQIVQNYLNNVKLCNLMIGTVVIDGIRISDKLTLPYELIKGNQKDLVTYGDKVRLLRNHGGHEFYIVEILGFNPVLSGTTISIEPITIGSTTISSITVKDVSR